MFRRALRPQVMMLRARKRVKAVVTEVKVEEVEVKEEVVDTFVGKRVDLSFLDIYKDGVVPTPMEDKDYPGWLWEVAQRPLTLLEMERVPFDQMRDIDKKKMFKLARRKRIKHQNANSPK